MQFDIPEDTPFIRLSIRGPEPEEQVVLVNEVMTSYLRTFGDHQDGSNAGRLRAIEKALATARGDLAERRKSLIESESKGDGLEGAALRDEIAVKEELVKRLLTAFEEMKLHRENSRELILVQLVNAAEMPKAK